MMLNLCGSLIVFLLTAGIALPVLAGEAGLVFHESFDTPFAARDSGAAPRFGSANGPLLVKNGDGYAALFNGRDNVVDAGDAAKLGISDAVSVSVWVKPDARPTAEPGIVVAGSINNFGLTYYKDGQVYWYVNGGGNNCHSGISPGSWSHLVGTYDGKRMSLYVNGKLCDSRPYDQPIHATGRLVIGKRPSANYFFAGLIDEVRIYDRALPPKQVDALYQQHASAAVAQPPPIKEGVRLNGQGYTLVAGPHGGVEIHIGQDVWFMDSAYSHPGDNIGWNRLTQIPQQDSVWKVRVETKSDVIHMSADGQRYHLERTITPDGRRVIVRDTLTNDGNEDVGIIVRNLLTSAGDLTATRLCGADAAAGDSSSNPTVFLARTDSALGAVAQDDVLRVQFEASTQLMRQASFGARHIGLKPGKSVTLEFALYPMHGGSTYWDLINMIREDWGVNHKLIGPGSFIDLTSEPYWSIFHDQEKLRKYLDRNQLKVILLTPWLDYENLNRITGKLVTRNDYRRMMREVYRNIKTVDPQMRVLGCLEGPFVSIPDRVIKPLMATLPKTTQGYYMLSKAGMAVLHKYPDVWQRWADSIVWTRDGHARVELYYRGNHRPLMALTVRPQLGNGQYKYLLNQIQFIIEDVGLDGYYIDSWVGAKADIYGYSYDKWDGITVDIDPRTGRITDRYTDLALAGTTARQALIKYGLSRDKTVVVNDPPISAKTQSLDYMAFNESMWVFDPTTWADGSMPPLQQRPCNLHLFTPISLGFRPGRFGADADYAKIIMKGAIAFLRHGVLYFHYGTQLPPPSAPGGGGYGPFNHMYPITPVRLGPGFVVGRQRIVTAVSGDFKWHHEAKPNVLVFDLHGLPVKHAIESTRAGDNAWVVPLKIEDWRQIAIIEPSRPTSQP